MDVLISMSISFLPAVTKAKSVSLQKYELTGEKKRKKKKRFPINKLLYLYNVNAV